MSGLDRSPLMHSIADQLDPDQQEQTLTETLQHRGTDMINSRNMNPERLHVFGEEAQFYVDFVGVGQRVGEEFEGGTIYLTEDRRILCYHGERQLHEIEDPEEDLKEILGTYSREYFEAMEFLERIPAVNLEDVDVPVFSQKTAGDRPDVSPKDD